MGLYRGYIRVIWGYIGHIWQLYRVQGLGFRFQGFGLLSRALGGFGYEYGCRASFKELVGPMNPPMSYRTNACGRQPEKLQNLPSVS